MRIDEFLKYYNDLSLNGVKTQIEEGVWVNAQPLSFSDGILTKSYWKKMYKRVKDAWSVLRGKSIAVTWEK